MRVFSFKLIALSFLIGCTQQHVDAIDNPNIEQTQDITDGVEISDSNLWEIEFYYEDEVQKHKITPPIGESLNIEEGYEEQMSFIELSGDVMSDLIIDLGWIGTGGGLNAIFINQGKNKYRKVFEEYLKSPEFIQEKNGWFSIINYEEIEVANPSKLQKTIFKFNEQKYQYVLDTTYVIYSDSIN